MRAPVGKTAGTDGEATTTTPDGLPQAAFLSPRLPAATTPAAQTPSLLCSPASPASATSAVGAVSASSQCHPTHHHSGAGDSGAGAGLGVGVGAGARAGAVAIGERGAVQLILGAMRSMPAALELQTCACAALRVLVADVKNAALLARTVYDVDGGDDDDEDEDDDDTEQDGSEAEDEDEDDEEDEEGGQVQGKGEGPSGAGGAGGVNGVYLLRAALQTHVRSHTLAANACAAIANVAAKWPPSRAAPGIEGVIEAIVAAMREHAHVARVQVHACHALQVLSATAANRVATAGLGGLHAIVGALREHRASKPVVASACAALSLLVTMDASNAKAAGVAGGVAVVLDAMREHEASETVQQVCCGLLSHLSDVWQPIRSAPPARACESSAPSPPGTSGSASAAASAPARVGELATECHDACQSNREEMRDGGAVDLLQAAATRFPAACKFLSSNVLRKL